MTTGMRFAVAAVAAVLAAKSLPAHSAGRDFNIYFVDTEGGQSVIYQSPDGESLMVDTGRPDAVNTAHILEALEDAGIRQIDWLVTSHYDLDHVGGLKELAARIPIRHFVDHGPSVSTVEPYPGFQSTYASIFARGQHHVAKAGEKLPVKGLDVQVVTSANGVLKKPLRGGGKPNAECTGFKPHPEADDENAQSVGLLIRYGAFRTINLADFTWNSEFNLMCPTNPIGGVDLYVTSHHGLDRSGSVALVHGLHPRVAILNNAPRKGGTAQTLNTLHTSPGLEDVWQLHWGEYAGLEYNAPGQFIANMDDPPAAAEAILHPPQRRPAAAVDPATAAAAALASTAYNGHSPACWIKVAVHADATFTVSNSRNGFSKTYR